MSSLRTPVSDNHSASEDRLQTGSGLTLMVRQRTTPGTLRRVSGSTSRRADYHVRTQYVLAVFR